MIPKDWLASADPRPMLDFLRGQVSDRKLRLFACACCRRVLHLLGDPDSRWSFHVAERFAEGQAKDAERSAARKAAQRFALSRGVSRPPPKWERRVASAVYYAAASAATDAASHAPQFAVEALIGQAGGYNAPGWEQVRDEERRHQAAALREVVGNPFRDITLARHWLTSAVVALARSAYEDSAFDLLPILGDALEDAGCAEAELLDHLRGSGPHARGCWALDLILGKG